MAKITKNFSLEEFKCKDGGDIPNSALLNIVELARNLEVLRTAINKPITIKIPAITNSKFFILLPLCILLVKDKETFDQQL